jgi:hypothetical protein
LRLSCPRLLRTVSCCSSNTPRLQKCMIPLHELTRHLERHSSRRPPSLSGRKFVILHGASCFPPGLLALPALRTLRPPGFLHPDFQDLRADSPPLHAES